MAALNAQFTDEKDSRNHKKVYPENSRNPYDENNIKEGTFLEDSWKPAISLAQVVQIGDTMMLYTAQAGDTSIFIELENGAQELVQKTCGDNGIGRRGGGIATQSRPLPKNTRRIIIVSDGIGEFLLPDEFKEVVNANKDDNSLLAELKAKITNTDRSNIPQGIVAPTAAHGGAFKIYDQSRDSRTDDISLCVLRVQNS